MSQRIVHQQQLSVKLDEYLKSKGVSPHRFNTEAVELMMTMDEDELDKYLSVDDNGIIVGDTDAIIGRMKCQ
jgi:hypothetical protein